MTKYTFHILSLIISIFPALFLYSIWDQVPQSIPMHYDMEGSVDRYGAKSELIYFSISPLFVFIFIHAILWLLNKKLNSHIILGINLIVSGTIFALLFTVTESELSEEMSPFLLIGVMTIIMGFILRYTDRNSLIGIRIPYTLDDPVIWEETHIYASKLLVISGVLILLSNFLVTPMIIKFTSPTLIILSVILSLKKASDLYDKSS